MKSKKLTGMSAEQFVERLKTYDTPQERKRLEGLDQDKDNKTMGVKMGQIFALAKDFIDMPLDDIETLLESPIHEVRVGAVSIMDFQARRKKTSEQRRRALYELYLRRHDRINNWDLVDRAAPYVIGGYLIDKPRNTLHKLAHSKDIWERRTAIVSTYFFIRQGDVDDTFDIAELLVQDEQKLIQTAVGGWVREAGKKDPKRLLSFLDKHAANMPRTALRFAIEKLDKKLREHYLSLKREQL